MKISILHTDRLILRHWKSKDMPLFASLNAHPEVMAHFPAVLCTKESENLAQRIITTMENQGWGLWAMQRKADKKFMGFTGLQWCAPTLPFAPALEVGWRLAREFWSYGYASEAARASVNFAFEVLMEKEVVSFTAKSNLRSQAVMQRLGMSHKASFEHPLLPTGHPLCAHVLFARHNEEGGS